MNTKKHSKINKTPNVAGKRKSSTNSPNIYPKALWKDANGDIFYKENGKFLPFTGDIEKWLGVEES